VLGVWAAVLRVCTNVNAPNWRWAAHASVVPVHTGAFFRDDSSRIAWVAIGTADISRRRDAWRRDELATLACVTNSAHARIGRLISKAVGGDVRVWRTILAFLTCHIRRFPGAKCVDELADRARVTWKANAVVVQSRAATRGIKVEARRAFHAVRTRHGFCFGTVSIARCADVLVHATHITNITRVRVGGVVSRTAVVEVCVFVTWLAILARHIGCHSITLRLEELTSGAQVARTANVFVRELFSRARHRSVEAKGTVKAVFTNDVWRTLVAVILYELPGSTIVARLAHSNVLCPVARAFSLNVMVGRTGLASRTRLCVHRTRSVARRACLDPSGVAVIVHISIAAFFAVLDNCARFVLSGATEGVQWLLAKRPNERHDTRRAR